MNRIPALLLIALLGPGPLWAAKSNFELDPEPVRPNNLEEGTKWKEGQVALPAWPADADLLPLIPEHLETPFRFYIDARNLKIDRDGGVVRYTLVAEAPSGVRNLSYEGIRCTLRGAYKVYGYGSGGRFERAPASDWQPLPTKGSEAYREDLWRNRFCVPRETRARRPDEIQRALRDRAVHREGTGFQAD